MNELRIERKFKRKDGEDQWMDVRKLRNDRGVSDGSLGGCKASNKRAKAAKSC